MLSQCERILAYIEKYGSITNLEAQQLRRPILQFTARMSDLRHKGWSFQSEWEESVNTGVKYKRYFNPTNRFEVA